MNITNVTLEELLNLDIGAVFRENVVNRIYEEIGSDFFLFPVLSGALKFVERYEQLFRDRGMSFYRFDLEQEHFAKPGKVREIVTDPSHVKEKRKKGLILDDDAHLGHSSLGAVVWALENRDILGIDELFLLVECDALGIANFSPIRTHSTFKGIPYHLRRLDSSVYEKLKNDGAFSILSGYVDRPLRGCEEFRRSFRPLILRMICGVENASVDDVLGIVNKLGDLYGERVLSRQEIEFLISYGNELVRIVNTSLKKRLRPRIAGRFDGYGRESSRYFARLLEQWCLVNNVHVEYNEMFCVWDGAHPIAKDMKTQLKPYEICGGISKNEKIIYVSVDCNIGDLKILDEAVRKRKIPNNPLYATLVPPQLVCLPVF